MTIRFSLPVVLLIATPVMAQDIAEIERLKREDLIQRCIRRIHFEWPSHKDEFKFLSAKANLNNIWIKYYTKTKSGEQVHQYWCSFSHDRTLRHAQIVE